MKSSWAYNNGKRMMREAKESLQCDKNGWIKRRDVLMYAEKAYNTLMIKGYSNKKQADKMVEKQKKLGHDVYRSNDYPFTICKEKSQLKGKLTKMQIAKLAGDYKEIILKQGRLDWEDKLITLLDDPMKRRIIFATAALNPKN